MIFLPFKHQHSMSISLLTVGTGLQIPPLSHDIYRQISCPNQTLLYELLKKQRFRTECYLTLNTAKTCSTSACTCCRKISTCGIFTLSSVNHQRFLLTTIETLDRQWSRRQSSGCCRGGGGCRCCCRWSSTWTWPRNRIASCTIITSTKIVWIYKYGSFVTYSKRSAINVITNTWIFLMKTIN